MCQGIADIRLRHGIHTPKLKHGRLLWDSQAQEPFKQLLIRERRGCRDKGNTGETRVQPWGRSQLPIKGHTEQCPWLFCRTKVC